MTRLEFGMYGGFALVIVVCVFALLFILVIGTINKIEMKFNVHLSDQINSLIGNSTKSGN